MHGKMIRALLFLGDWLLKLEPPVQITIIVCCTVLLNTVLANPALLIGLVPSIVQLWSALKGNAGCNCNH